MGEEIWKDSALRSQKLRLLSADITNFAGSTLKKILVDWHCGGFVPLLPSLKKFATCVTVCRNLIEAASPDFIFTSGIIWNIQPLSAGFSRGKRRDTGGVAGVGAWVEWCPQE